MDWTGITLRDGYSALPDGAIASVVTFLEMTSPPKPRPEREAVDLALHRLTAADVERYARVYRVIGERWVWFSRLGIPADELARLLEDPRREAYALAGPGGDIGFMEIDRRVEDEPELVYFGLVEDAIGRGAGRWMMNRAIEAAFSRPISRFWLHTCTLDHPGAIAFYRRSGFTPYKLAVEVTDDPRALGLVPPDIWPDLPPPTIRREA
jgi:GNAT superfamily N-acetyltransferase